MLVSDEFLRVPLQERFLDFKTIYLCRGQIQLRKLLSV